MTNNKTHTTFSTINVPGIWSVFIGRLFELMPDDNDGLTVSVEWNGTWGENECLGLVRNSTPDPKFIVACVAVT